FQDSRTYAGGGAGPKLGPHPGPPPDESEPPRPLRRAIPAALEYPVEALGPFMAPAAQAIQEKIRCPMAIAPQSILAVTCLAVQGHADVELPTGARRPISLYLVTIGESGERKTAADDEALVAVRERESQLRASYACEIQAFERE